jgi:hypothetical protein
MKQENDFTELIEPIDFVNEIDNNINKNGSEWEIWSGAFNRNLRKADPKKFPYIFSYWQVQNAIKTSGKTAKRMNDLKEIKKIILE